MFGHHTAGRKARVATIVVALALLFIGCFSTVSVAKAATIDELQAMISALMAQIAAMQATSGSSAGSTGLTGTTTGVMHIGTPVSITALLRVRVTPGVNSLFIATQPIGATGVIVEGPVVKDGYNWFKVDYATGTDGWNVGSWLRSRTDLPDLKGTYVGYMNGAVFITTENITRADAVANCKNNAAANPTSVVRCTWRGVEVYLSTATKSTPHIIEAMGPVDASFVTLKAVFLVPETQVTSSLGPVKIGSVNWGDSNIEDVNALANDNLITISRKHTYASNGLYTITVTGLDGKTDTKTVSITVLLPKPVTTGLYRAYKSGRLTVETNGLTKATAQTNCQTAVAASLTVPVRCEWNSHVIFATGIIYENPDVPVRILSVTNAAMPIVSGTASGTASVHVILGDLTGGDASVVNGMWSYTSTVNIPTGKYVVTAYVNSNEVARREFSIQLSDVSTATTTPNKNSFGCGRTVNGGTFANGAVGCYGMWDYGSTFGNDHYTCGDLGTSKTGCLIKTKVCTSGNAKATAYYAGTDLTATKLNMISARLNTTSAIAKNEIAGLWEYSCTPAPQQASTTGAVLGASTDVYAEIAATLAGIQAALAALK